VNGVATGLQRLDEIELQEK
jgi:hypothetical protein